MDLNTKSLLHRTLVVSNKAGIQDLVRKISREVLVADAVAEAFDIARTVKPHLVVFDSWFSPAHVKEFSDMADENLKHHLRSDWCGMADSSTINGVSC
ncbi:MAG: hypothetical protein JSU70_04055 [Phycisphaerales bacterium]|nr:MAG: hypothetical protein JSU70_04055 [Phycisphaerales bacterium]